MKAIFKIVFFSAFLLSCAASQTRLQSAVTKGSETSKPDAGLPEIEPIESNEKTASSINAQDVTGEWQGIYKGKTKEHRFALYIAKRPDGSLYAVSYFVDDEEDFSIPAPSVTFTEPSLKIDFGPGWCTFEGTVSSDGTSLQGTWTDEEDPPPVRLDLNRATKETAWLEPLKLRFVAVDNNVQLEVLDWGGSGLPLVFLAGRAATAHIYRQFAPKFVSKYHVYGITRRGFGGSSIPSSGYLADRLADDVLAVIDALNLEKPVLVGHSLGGEEMSSIGSRHPEKVAGLIYLDALYQFSYYDQTHGSLEIDPLEIKRKLEQYHLQFWFYGADTQEERQTISDLLKELPRLERLLRARQKELKAVPSPKAAADEQQAPPQPLPDKEQAAPSPLPVDPIKEVTMGFQRYTHVRAPILAICALPLKLPDWMQESPADRAQETKRRANLIKAFKKGNPKARVVELANASHCIWRSHEADVLREMNAFLDGLEGSWSAE